MDEVRKGAGYEQEGWRANLQGADVLVGNTQAHVSMPALPPRYQPLGTQDRVPSLGSPGGISRLEKLSCTNGYPPTLRLPILTPLEI